MNLNDLRGDGDLSYPPARPAPADELPPAYRKLAAAVIISAVKTVSLGRAPYDDPEDTVEDASGFLSDTSGDLDFWCILGRVHAEHIRRWMAKWKERSAAGKKMLLMKLRGRHHATVTEEREPFV